MNLLPPSHGPALDLPMVDRSPRRRFLLWLLVLFTLWPLLGTRAVASSSSDRLTASHSIIVGEYDPVAQDFLWAREANDLIGTSALYGMGYWGIGSRVASVEGGIAWEGHEVFRQRREGIPISLGPGISVIYTPNTFNQNASVPYEPETAPAADQYSGHATAVAAMIGGLTMNEAGQLLIIGTGIAPLAELQSGGIAINDVPDDPNGFVISKESFLLPYLAYFRGDGAEKPAMDVINSSWGYADATGRNYLYAGIIDGLANENRTVALVGAAGNTGAGTQPGGPAGGFNAITVGAATHNGQDPQSFDRPASFTPDQALDFYNPVTQVTSERARAGIHVVAPGTDMLLPAYDPEQPAEDELFYINAAGTSFAAPMVSGGIALLKEMARDQLPGNVDALDTRVIRSILMAGATKTAGWNNHQTLEGDGVLRTHQALDYRTGAGMVNLAESAAIYLNPATPFTSELTEKGWDFNTISEGQTISYTLAFSDDPIELTLSLNWFTQTVYLDDTETYEDLWFSNLDLSVWRLGAEPSLVAESVSLYNTSEFLRLHLEGDAQYSLRITHTGMVYGTLGGPESYALAWTTQAIPEPSTWALLLFTASGLFMLRKRRLRMA